MKISFLVIVFLLFGMVNVHAAVNPLDLKGAMIQRIISFIEWPNCNKTEIVIGVYGDEKSYDRFKRLYSNQITNGRTIAVKSFDQSSQLDSLQKCDILYIGDISDTERSRILHKVPKNSILVVGNTRDDALSGVCVALVEDGSRYKILINQDALKHANLKADYRLLKLAELVGAK